MDNTIFPLVIDWQMLECRRIESKVHISQGKIKSLAHSNSELRITFAWRYQWDSQKGKWEKTKDLEVVLRIIGIKWNIQKDNGRFLMDITPTYEALHRLVFFPKGDSHALYK